MNVDGAPRLMGAGPALRTHGHGYEALPVNDQFKNTDLEEARILQSNIHNGLVLPHAEVSRTADSRLWNLGGTIKQHASSFDLEALAVSVKSLRHLSTQDMEQKLPQLGKPFWACVFYSVVSTSMVIVNKLLLSTYGFKFPMVLLFHQSLMTVNLLYIGKWFRITTFESLEAAKVMYWLPLDVFFVLMLLTGFYSVRLLSVPMVTIFKNTNNIFIALGDGLVFHNYPSSGVLWTMLLMLFAAIMAALNDLEYTFDGYLWTFANCISSTCFVLYAQTAIAKTNLSTFGKVYYNNLLSLPLVLALDVLVFKDFERLFTLDESSIRSFLTLDFICLWFVSGALGFLQSFFSLKAQHLTSPTTYSMVGSLNKIPLTLFGVWIFHSPITIKGGVYISLSILAGTLYSYTKANEEALARAHRQNGGVRTG